MKTVVEDVISHVQDMRGDAVKVAAEHAWQAETQVVYQGAKGMLASLDALTYLRELKASMDLCDHYKMCGQYIRISEQLTVQAKLRPYFTEYKAAPVVERLLNRIDEFQEDLLNDILAEFRWVQSSPCYPSYPRLITPSPHTHRRNCHRHHTRARASHAHATSFHTP